MRTVRTVADVRAAVAAARAEGHSVGLVPTMGAFHDGHLALIRAARAATGLVVVWLFVNPTQFNEQADLAAYPRDEARDAGLAEAAGVDVLFAPGPEEVYPAGFATTVTVDGLTDPGRASTAPATSPAWRPSSPRCSTWSARTPPTSAPRTRSRSQSCAAWSATSTSRSRSRSCRPCARPTDWP